MNKIKNYLSVVKNWITDNLLDIGNLFVYILIFAIQWIALRYNNIPLLLTAYAILFLYDNLKNSISIMTLKDEVAIINSGIVEVGMVCVGDEYIPKYAHEGDSGMDLRAYITEPVTLEPGSRIAINTGVQITDMGSNRELQIRSKSGLACNKGIMVLNSPGTIDSNYRGELIVILYNSSKEPYVIEPMSKVAQLVSAKVDTIMFNLNSTTTSRQADGFGSTDNK